MTLPPRRLRAALLAVSLGLAATPLWAGAATRTALQQASAYSPTYTSPLAPGVTLQGLRSQVGGGTADSNVVTVDLAQPGVATSVLTRRVTDVTPLAGLVTAPGTVAAVNGDYFAVAGSRAAAGPEVVGGVVHKATATPTSVEGVGTDGLARRAQLWLTATVQWGRGRPQAVERYNSDLDGADMGRDSLSVFDPRWGASRVGFAHAPAKASLVLVGRSGKVIKAARRFTPQTVPAGGVLLLDGGGSTTLQARTRGEASTSQVGALQIASQRPVPNAIAVTVPQGSGQLAGIDATTDSAVVFPGLQRRLRLRPYDEWFGPATTSTPPSDVTSAAGTFTPSGPLRVRAAGAGSDDLSVSLERFTATTALRVLGGLTSLSAPAELRVEPGASASIRLQGTSSQREQAPVDALDVATQVDPAVATVTPGAAGELIVSPLPGTLGAVTPVTFTVGERTVTTLLRTGWHDTDLPDLGTRGVWSTKGARGTPAPSGPRYGGTGLRLVLQAQGRTTLTPKAGPVALPADVLRLALWAKADGRRHLVQAVVADAAGRSRLVTLGVLGSSKGWQRLEVPLPGGSVSLRELRVVDPGGTVPGSVQLDGLTARS